MKQKITAIQLVELSDKEKDRLFDWMAKKGYWNKSLDRMEYLPFIGQLIEFLDEHDPSTTSPSGGYWWDYLFRIMEGQIVPLGGYNENYVVDALWEATKQILEQEEE